MGVFEIGDCCLWKMDYMKQTRFYADKITGFVEKDECFHNFFIECLI